MESSLTAPFHGRVRQVLVGANVHVAAQAPLLQLEPLDGGPPPASGERVAFASYPPRPTGAEALPRAAAAPGMARARLRRRPPPRSSGSWPTSMAVRRPAGRPCDRGRRAPPAADVRRRARGVAPAPRRGRSRDPVAAQPAGAPQRLAGLARRRGRRAARPTSWRCCAQRSPTTGSTISTVRPRWRRRATGCTSPRSARRPRARPSWRSSTVAWSRPGSSPGTSATSFREALDHLVAATDGRDAVVADLAREVRYRYFDEPVIAAARERVYAEMAEHVAALAEDPSRPDRDERIAALVACPRPLAALLTARMRAAEPALQRLLVEATARRYYRVRALEGFELARIDGCELLMARYPFQGRRRHLAAAYVDLDDVGAVASRLRAPCRHAARRRPGRARPLRRALRRGPDARRAGRDAARGARGDPVAPGPAPHRRGGRPARRADAGCRRSIRSPSVISPRASSRTRSCAACIR